MKDDSIELPPLPEWVDWPVTVSEMSASEIKEAMQDYARAAIEADRKRTAKQLSAYESLVASLEEKCTHMRKKYVDLKARTNPELLASERAANTILTAELEADRQRRGEVLVTKTPEGEIIAVTRQDDEGRILSVIAEADSKRRGEPVDESQRVYLHNEGRPEYLDGAQCQYVIERGKPYPHGDPVAFVYEKEDAERIVAALNNEPSRGEPVAWISRVKCVGPEYGKEYFGRLPVQSLNPLFYEHVPLYTAPQPAEPVKVPSDADLFAIHDEYFPTMVLGHDNYLRFARALLARYGNPSISSPEIDASAQRVDPEWQDFPK